MPDYKKFTKSITDELLAIKDRVRALLDKPHAGEDGRYKEAIFVDVLRRTLPDMVKIGTGFVIGDDNEQTTQIDIIVYDSRHPVVFQKGDFVIVSKDSVFGIIEVKTSLRSKSVGEVVKAIEKAGANGKTIMRSAGRTPQGDICHNRHTGINGIFNCIMSYESDKLYDHPKVKAAIVKSNGFLNHIAFGKDTFMKYWNNNVHNQFQHNENLGDRKANPFCRFYEIEDLAFGYFISNLIECIHIKALNKHLSRQDLLFPFAVGKNTYKIDNADVEIATGEHINQRLLSKKSNVCEDCGVIGIDTSYVLKNFCNSCLNKFWDSKSIDTEGDDIE